VCGCVRDRQSQILCCRRTVQGQLPFLCIVSLSASTFNIIFPVYASFASYTMVLDTLYCSATSRPFRSFPPPVVPLVFFCLFPASVHVCIPMFCDDPSVPNAM